MEGPTTSSNKLRFTESRRKFRLSQNTVPQSGYKLIAAANNHKLVILGFPDETIKAIELNLLLDFTQSKERAAITDLNQYAFTLKLTFCPQLITVACHGFSSVLLVCGQQTNTSHPIIEAFDLDTRTSIGKIELVEYSGAEVIDYAWSPTYFDSIVALCTNQGQLLVVAIDRPKGAICLAYKNVQFGALTCCWSPKGKNLAVGLSNGSIIRLEPQISGNIFSFKEVDKSTLTFMHQKMTPNHRVIKLRWINKNFLLAIHARMNDPGGPDTVHSIITVKPSKPYRYWTNLCYENTTSSNYTTHVVNLSNVVVCSSNTSGEASVLGVEGASEAARNDLEDWKSIMIDEEGAKVELPLDRKNCETSTASVSLAQADHPILLFYTSDGVLLAYAAIHHDSILKFPEFQPKQACPLDVPKTFQGQQSSAPSFQPQASSLFSSTLQKPTFHNPLSGSMNFQAQPSGLFSSTSQKLSFQNPVPAATSVQPQSTSLFSSTLQKPTFHNPLAGGINLQSQSSNLFSSASQKLSFQNPSPAATNVLSQPTSLFSSTLQAPTFHNPLAGSVNSQSQTPNLFSSTSQKLTFQNSSPAVTDTSQPQQSSLFSSKLSELTFQSPLPVTTSAQAQPTSLFSATLPKSEPQAAESEPLVAKPGPLVTKPESLVAKPEPLVAKPEPLVAKPDPLVANSDPLTARFQSITAKSQPLEANSELKRIEESIYEVKKTIGQNQDYLASLEEVNSLKVQFDYILDIHKSLREVLDVSHETIESMTVQMLDNMYLVEYVKLHNKDGSRKRTIDRLTLEKVEAIKKKTKALDASLRELDSNVEVAWEDYNRNRSNSGTRGKQLKSVDLIYKNLATNQKIINILKRVASENSEKSPSVTKAVDYVSEPILPTIKELDPVKLRNFKEFLSSRDSAPVRRSD